MANQAAPVRHLALTRPQTTVDTLRGEIVRKGLHLLIALVPMLASFNLSATVALLATGTLFYVFAEKMRITGRTVFIVSDLTVLASRERDRGHFVIGPVTLGLGAMLALLLYPSAAASIAVYALAFGDGLASLAGKMFHTPRSGTRGKTVAGSLACFAAVLLSCLRLTGSPLKALLIALAATALEAIPVRDFDNLILPVGTGFLATISGQLSAAASRFLVFQTHR
jgi:dolichol kinase